MGSGVLLYKLSMYNNSVSGGVCRMESRRGLASYACKDEEQNTCT